MFCLSIPFFISALIHPFWYSPAQSEPSPASSLFIVPGCPCLGGVSQGDGISIYLVRQSTAFLSSIVTRLSFVTRFGEHVANHPASRQVLFSGSTRPLLHSKSATISNKLFQTRIKETGKTFKHQFGENASIQLFRRL